jgi:F-type H+-transporting ATPase subunit epsilon
MPAVFKLEIITPEHEFLNTDAQALTADCLDGEITVLAGHAPMVAALKVGELKIQVNGAWRTAFHSEGFIDVRPDEVLVFSQACEWPEDIDAARALEAENRATEKLRQKQSLVEYHHNRMSLARAMARLKLSNSNNSLND